VPQARTAVAFAQAVVGRADVEQRAPHRVGGGEQQLGVEVGDDGGGAGFLGVLCRSTSLEMMLSFFCTSPCTFSVCAVPMTSSSGP
jgi:hypothetical protein